MIVLLSSVALSSTWNTSAPHNFEIVAEGPRAAFGGEVISIKALACEIRAGNCDASLDLGNGDYTSSWPWVTCRNETIANDVIGNHPRLGVFFDFETPLLAGGETTWPTSWPAYVDCAGTFPDGTHTIRVYLAPSPDRQRWHPVDPAIVAWGSTQDLHVPSSATGMGLVLHLPPGATSQSGLDALQATSGSVYPKLFCIVDDASDLLHVGANSNTAAGLARCPVVHDGLARDVFINVTL